ncbi:energy transducer TonB [Opitutus terrae]|uniref:TonB family protein n=1 Tax=Opitutus terrae (strain DSM 11246 / JCM 15787 / PB90-1) TaxID=452637 RepID=B1ZZ44_OPITP|nr:energy transducer TonB [Opitutus terrae]ACB77116.1 TonB family protein [Opitutus terrae PB90-1]
MQTRFILPVIVATAFHALVFFGFNGRPPTVVLPGSDPEPKMPAMPQPPVIDELIEIVDHATLPDPIDQPKRARKGDADVGPPQRPETLTDEKVPWAIPYEPVKPGPVGDMNRIPVNIGDPNGDPNSDVTNAPVDMKYLDNPPRLRGQIAPIYPAAARADGLNGQVDVEFLVDETGRVIRATVVRSTAAIFEEPTLRAVQQWRFEPGKRLGRPVKFRMVAPVVFNLSE